MQQQTNVKAEITTSNTPSLTLGIISLILGVLALLVGWVPFLGLLAIPTAAIGGILAAIGIAIALAKKFKGIGMPFLGGSICTGAIILPLFMTGTTTVAIAETANQTMEEVAQRRAEEEAQRIAQEEQLAKETSDYINTSLDIYDIESRYFNSFLDGEVPGILFKIKNNGDRTLNRITVTAYFEDSSGAVIAEEEYNPVFVSPYSIQDDQPLKPGYIWQMEPDKFFSAKSVPSEWEEGRVRVEVTSIEFAD